MPNQPVPSSFLPPIHSSTAQCRQVHRNALRNVFYAPLRNKHHAKSKIHLDWLQDRDRALQAWRRETPASSSAPQRLHEAILQSARSLGRKTYQLER